MISVKTGYSGYGVWVGHGEEGDKYYTEGEAEELFTALSREIGCRYVDSLTQPIAEQVQDWDDLAYIDIERDYDNG